MVSDEYLDRVGLFDGQKVGKLFDRYRHGKVTVDNEVQNMAICGIISTQLLYYQFVENFPWKPVAELKPDKFVRLEG
jgi:asparagine synthase (glutamine-hydrolysing)